MRKIINPFCKDADCAHHCFGCSPFNPIGLHLEFFEEDGTVFTSWKPHKQLEGYKDILHGGIQATILDEAASWTVYTQCNTVGVTSGMDIKYRHPAVIDGEELKIEAKISSQNSRFAVIDVKIKNSKGKICSEASVTYYLFSEDVARQKYHYPGIEGFYE